MAALQLADMIPWGRTYEEYTGMFALDGADRSRSLLAAPVDVIGTVTHPRPYQTTGWRGARRRLAKAYRA